MTTTPPASVSPSPAAPPTPSQVRALDDFFAALHPWTDLLLSYGARCELTNPSRVEQGLLFDFAVPLNRVETLGGMRKLREAIDLVYRLLVVQPMLAFAIRQSTEKVPEIRAIDDPTVQRVLAIGRARVEMRVTLRADYDSKVSDVKKTVADAFYVDTSRAPSTERAFVWQRDLLNLLLESHTARWADAVERRVTCVVDLGSISTPLDADETDGFVVELVEFVQTLNQDVQTVPVAAGGHVPLQFVIKDFEFGPLPITPAVVKAVAPLANLPRVPLKCSVVRLDPRYVTCSHDELGEFLQVLTHDVPNGARVELLPFRLEFEPMDDHDNSNAFIEGLMKTIVSCDNVHQFNPGLLLQCFELLKIELLSFASLCEQC